MCILIDSNVAMLKQKLASLRDSPDDVEVSRSMLSKCIKLCDELINYGQQLRHQIKER